MPSLLIYPQVTCEIKIRNISDILMKSFEEHLKCWLFGKKGTLCLRIEFDSKESYISYHMLTWIICFGCYSSWKRWRRLLNFIMQNVSLRCDTALVVYDEGCMYCTRQIHNCYITWSFVGWKLKDRTISFHYLFSYCLLSSWLLLHASFTISLLFVFFKMISLSRSYAKTTIIEL